MSVVKHVVFLLSLACSPLCFSAACPASGDATTAGNGDCTVSGSVSTIQLNFNSGFDSNTAIATVDGNNGTTIGAQRKLSFIKAAEIISDLLISTITIEVDASFSALSCDTNSATLGSAGATNNFAYGSAPSGLDDNTFYPVGLINAIRSTDVDGGSDITAEFNSDIGDGDCLAASDWYYGFGTPGANEIGFTTVLLHEITHGLGFASLVNPTDGSKASGNDDIFSNNLFDLATGLNFNDGAETNQNREDAAISGTGLLWSGSNANTNAVGLLTDGFNDVDGDGTFESGDKIEMYAPGAIESGSSVSHFNTDAAPNELMEPSYTEGQDDLGLALYLLQDLGWSSTANSVPEITAVDQTVAEEDNIVVDISTWGSDDDNDALTYSVTACATNITCSLVGTDLTLTPDANHYGATHAITLEVDDGNGGTESDTFNLEVTNVSDDPTIVAVDQTTSEDIALVVDISSWGADVDDDTLSYSVTTCATNITCDISGTNLTLTPAADHNGDTHSITIEVNDGNNNTATDTFNLVVSAVNDAPTLTAINQTIDEDTPVTIDISAWASDAEGDDITYAMTSCATNITCFISGNNLTLTPASNHNGNTHSISISATDDSNASSNDTFNLVVTAVNDAPTFSAPSSITISINQNELIDLSQFTQDVENDEVTFNIVSCHALLTCNITDETLSLLATTGDGQNVQISVSATDDNNASTTHIYNVNIVDDSPTVFFEIGSTDLHHGDTANIALNDVQVDVLGGSGNFSYTLTYEGFGASDLLSVIGTVATVELPDSGTFVGTYILTVTDITRGDVVTVNLIRDLRIVWSSTSLLNGINSHTLTIEGGEGGNTYTLTLSDSGVIKFLDEDLEEQTQFSADTDPTTFHRARLSIESIPVIETTTVEVTLASVNSDFTDVIETITVYPSVGHVISVVDILRAAVPAAQGTLDDLPLLDELNLELDYVADENGFINLLLPRDLESYPMTLSATGFNPSGVSLDATLSEHQVILGRVGDGILLSGTIAAAGNQNFVANPPIVKLNFSEGDSELIVVSVSNASEADFIHSVDLDEHTLVNMVITQAKSINHETDLSTLSQNQTFEITLERDPAIKDESGSSSSSSGPLSPYFILGFLILLGIKQRHKS
jgi:hypothetical protein